MAIYDFTGSNGDPLPTGLTAANGTFNINDNKLKATGSSPGSANWLVRLTTSPGSAELVTYCTVNCEGQTSGQTGLVLRYTDNSNHYFAVIDPSVGRLRLYKREANTNSLLGQYTIVSFSNTTNYLVEARITGNDFKIYLDGTLRVQETNAFNNTATGFGLRLPDTVVSIDNYVAIQVIADAGFNSTAYGGQQKTLNGIASSTIPAGGTITGWEWTQTAGDTVNPFTNNIRNPAINAPSKNYIQTITFSLRVNQGEEWSLPDTVNIDVSAGPEANAGPDQEVWVGDVVQLDGSGALIPAGLTVISYNWAQQTGSNQGAITTPDAVNATFTATSVQTTIPIDVEMRSIVTTSPNGTSNPDLVKIWILPNPVANAGPDQFSIPAGSTINFDGTASTKPDTYGISYLWTQVGGTAVTIVGDTTATPSVTAPSTPSPQNIVLSLVVTSNGKSSPADTVSAGVLAAGNLPPTAASGNQTGIAAGDTIQFDFSGSSDPDGTIATYNLTQTVGTTVSIVGGNTIPNPTAIAPSTGVDQTLHFSLTVTDNLGAVSPAVAFTIGVIANPSFDGIVRFTGNNGDPLPVEFDSLAGSGQINNNELMPLGSNPGTGWRFRYHTDFTTSEILALDVNCRNDITGQTGLLIRYIDGFNYIKAVINSNVGRMQFLKTEAGVETVLSQFTISPFSAATIYNVKVAYTPTTLVGYLDGTEVLNIGNTFGGSSVIAGIAIGRSTHAVDNFNIAATVAVNQKPIAVMTGPTAAVVAGAQFTLDFSASSDPDGSVATYTLVQTAGTNTGSDGTSAATSRQITAPNEESGQVLTYRMIATDNQGLASDAVFRNVTILSSAGNAPPTAVITGPTAPVPAGSQFVLDFSQSTDPDGSIVSYTLAQTLGTSTGSAGTSAATSKAIDAPDLPTPQTLRYRLITTDNLGAASAAAFYNVDVLSNLPNQPPIANAGPTQNNIPAGAVVQLDFTGSSDPDGTVATYTVAQVLGDSVGLSGTSTNPRPTFIAPIKDYAQQVRIRLIVTDNLGTPSVTASFVNINVLADIGVDVTPPVIRLIGPNPYNHPVGVPYVSPGSYVEDNKDVGIVPVITGTVDYTIAGTYSEFHNAVDAANNVALQVVRTVIVGAPLPTKPISRGTGSSSKSATPSMLDTLTPEIGLAHIEFELVRITWDLVNPAENVYDFSLIQKLIDRAKSYGKFVNLMIVDSFHAPQWVKDDSTTFEYPFQFTTDDPPVPIIRTSPLAWDSGYNMAKQKLVNQLAAAYDAEDAVRTVYFTYSTMTNGAEFHWRVDQTLYTNAGYNPTLQLGAAKNIFNYYKNAFRRTNIAIESHTVFGSIQLNRDLIEYARSEIGTRAGLALWWGASRIAVNDSGNDAEYVSWLLAEEHKAVGGFIILQCIGNFTDQAWRFNYQNHPEFDITDWTAEEAFTYERNFFDGGSIYNTSGTAVDAYEYWPKDTTNLALMPALLPAADTFSIATIIILGLPDGTENVQIYAVAVGGSILYTGAVNFVGGRGNIALSVPSGTPWFGAWFGTNPPTTGTGIYGVTA